MFWIRHVGLDHDIVEEIPCFLWFIRTAITVISFTLTSPYLKFQDIMRRQINATIGCIFGAYKIPVVSYLTLIQLKTWVRLIFRITLEISHLANASLKILDNSLCRNTVGV